MIETQLNTGETAAVVLSPRSWRRETSPGFNSGNTAPEGKFIPLAKRLGPDKPPVPQDPDIPPTPPELPSASGAPKEPAIVRLPFIGRAEQPGVLSIVKRPDGNGLIKVLRAKAAAQQQIAS